MSPRAVCLVLAVASVVSPLQAQGRPTPGTPKSFTLPATNSFRLPNGLAVSLVPYGNVPKVLMQVRVRAGRIHEAADEVWMAELVGDLLKEGTELRDAEAIAREAGRMGARLDVEVEQDLAVVGLDGLSEFAPRMAALLADVVGRPTFPATQVARVKTDRLRQLSIERSQPEPLGRELFQRLMYPDHPYGRLYPSEERLAAYTPAQVRSFHAANYGARRAHVYVVGRFERGPTEAAVRKAFGSWKAGRVSTPKPASPVSTGKIHLIDRPGAHQSTLLLGIPVAEPSDQDYVPLLVTNALLGGSFISRITTNIREDKGYTYSPYSEVSTRTHDAHWVQVADVTTEVTGPSLKEIRGEIDRLRREPPPTEELKEIQSYVAGLFVLRNSTRAGIAAQLSFLEQQGLDRGYLTGFVSRVRSVTPQQVHRVAQKHLRLEEMTLVLVGDRARVDSQIKPYGPIAR